MTRVKRGTIKNKKRKNILKMTKGYRHGRKSKLRQAREAISHAGNHAFNHRKQKKQNMRRDWQTTINYAVRPLGFSYSKFIDALKKKEVGVDRKILATLVKEEPKTFERVVEHVK